MQIIPAILITRNFVFLLTKFVKSVGVKFLKVRTICVKIKVLIEWFEIGLLCWLRVSHSKYFGCGDFRIFGARNFKELNRMYLMPCRPILNRNLSKLE